MTTRVISWNTAGRTKRVGDQIAWLKGRAPHIVALQEVIASSRDALRQGLDSIGLTYQVDTFDLGQSVSSRIGPRRHGLLTASKRPICQLEGIAPVSPWPERMLSALTTGANGGDIELHNAHVPNGSSNGWKKIEVFESIFDALAVQGEHPRVLCGDFNSPRMETSDGAVVTWGQRVRKDGTIRIPRVIRGEPGGRWDAGERSVLCGLAAFDLSDAFRRMHGYAVEEFSWKPHGSNPGRRFDHVFCSAALSLQNCRYHHEPREERLSDHSPIEVDFTGV